jgi:hypothetical protein
VRIVGLVVIAAAVCAPDGGAGTTRSLVVRPDVGISPVVLGESGNKVSERLGISIQLPGAGYVVYSTDGSVLEVAYTGRPLSTQQRIAVVASNDAAMTVYGDRLTRGREALMPVLRRHHWRFLTCNSRTPAAAHSSRSGLTLIEWPTAGPSVTVRRSSSFSGPCSWSLP